MRRKNGRCGKFRAGEPLRQIRTHNASVKDAKLIQFEDLK